MKNTTNTTKNANAKKSALAIVNNAKNAPVVAPVVETSAPKKPANRADILNINALAFDDIKKSDRLLFNDALHAEQKTVEKMLKYAYVIERDENSIFAVVNDAPYVFNRADVKNFTFAKCENAKNAPVTEFTNVKLTLKNLTRAECVAAMRSYMRHAMTRAFIEKNKIAFDAMTAKNSAK